MEKIDLTFKLKKVLDQRWQIPELKNHGEYDLFEPEETWYKPGGQAIFFLATEFSEEIRGRKNDINIILSLVKPGQEFTDVFYEELLNTDNIGKEFTIHDLDKDEILLLMTNFGHTMAINRRSYHNIIAPSVINSTITNFGKYGENWTAPSNEKIDNAEKSELNELIRKFNNEKENNAVQQLFVYMKDKLVNTR